MYRKGRENPPWKALFPFKAAEINNRPKIAPDFRGAVPFSEFTLSGREPFPDVVAPLYEEINKIYGTDYKPAL